MIRACVVGLSLVAPATPAAAQYRYTSIAEFPANPFVFVQRPPINNGGWVAFMNSAPSITSGAEGIRLGHGGAARTVIAVGFFDFRTRSLNDAGQTAAVSAEDGAVYRIASNGHATLIAAPEDTDPDFAYYDPAINARGTVAVVANLDKDGNTAVFMSRGGEAAPISDSEDGPLNFHSAPAINSQDVVAFSALNTAKGTFGVYVYRRSRIEQLYSNGTDPVINDRGVAAFTRFGALPGESSILRGNGGPLVLIADSTGAFSHVFASAINNQGEVAFLATLVSGGQGVYTGDGEHTQKVLATGDHALGRTVASVSMAGLNDHGELSLHATFTDNTSAIIRAEPEHH
jgi:hypothetical protein